ncbi:MAG: glycosyl transferase [uncultured bacterium]|nr:MAG: glycosyl transferase [uncultured bacterium]
MKNKPFFSIVIPTFNRVKDLERAILCLQKQSFTNIEILVIDNHSSDGTQNLMESFNDKRIKYVRNRKNIGFYKSLDKAFKNSRGHYIFLHGDDDFLFDRDSLIKVQEKIKKFHPGYIRVKYICRTPDEETFFDFRPIGYFTNNKHLPSHAKNKRIISFLVRTDPYFVTGIIFKNSLPKDVKIINTDPFPWVEILFHSAKNLGAYYISEPHIIASWSLWSKQNGIHPVYSLRDGRLSAEKFLNVVRDKLNEADYREFLHFQLMKIYVNLFPVIKLRMGNENLLGLSKRIREIDPEMEKDVRFWVYLWIALISPAKILEIVRNLYLYFLIKTAKINNQKKILNSINDSGDI